MLLTGLCKGEVGVDVEVAGMREERRCRLNLTPRRSCRSYRHPRLQSVTNSAIDDILGKRRVYMNEERTKDSQMPRGKVGKIPSLALHHYYSANDCDQ